MDIYETVLKRNGFSVKPICVWPERVDLAKAMSFV